MRESYIKNKICKILNLQSAKAAKDLQKQHATGRYINRMNDVIHRAVMDLEKHLIASAKQIAKEEFK